MGGYSLLIAFGILGLVLVLVLYAIVLLKVFRLIWKYVAAKDASGLADWARREQLRLVFSAARIPRLRSSPWIFFFPGQRLYRIVAEDLRGVVLYGWIRYGGFPGSDAIEARWDDSQSQRAVDEPPLRLPFLSDLFLPIPQDLSSTSNEKQW